MIGLTIKQRAVLEYVRSFVAKHAYPPTRAEIAEGLGFKSPNAAQCHLAALKAKGAISFNRGARTLRVLK